MKISGKIRATLSYGLIQAALWSFFAIWMGFSSNFLYTYGFSDGQISLVLGVVTALSIGFQLVVAELVSRIPRLKMYQVMIGSGVAMLLCALGAMLFQNSRVPAVICFCISCLLLQTFPAMANSLGMEAIERGAPVIFGLSRGCGSFLYSVTAFITGFLVGEFGTDVLSVVAIVTSVLFLMGVLIFHFTEERGLPEFVEKPKQEEQKNEKEKGFLSRYPKFALFLVGSTLLCFSHNLISNFLLQIMMLKGGDATDQGVASAIAAFVEIPIMFSFAVIVKWMRCDKWVKLSLVFFVLRSLTNLLAPTPELVCVAQLTQMLGYGLFNISTVSYAAAVVGKGEATRAQSYLASTLTIGTLISMSTGGVLCQYFGVEIMMIVSLAFSVVGSAVVLLSSQKTE